MNAEILLEELKRQGAKMSRVRRGLVEIFCMATHPLTVPELLEQLAAQGSTVNKTSVYRELEFLIDREVVQVLELGTVGSKYELHGHHHHAVCSNCQAVFCLETPELEAPLHAWEQRLTDQYGFSAHQHLLHFSGLCQNCNS